VKKRTIIVALLASISAHAEILGFNELVVNFTNPAVAVTNAICSEPDKFLVSTNGLGWGVGQTNEYRDFWVQSVPVAIGTSWRPARAANVTVEIDSQPSDNSSFYVRYSPDKKHWSSWQALDQHHGLIAVPQSASGDYDQRFSEYSKMDVPWRNDEEAAVKWILQRQPDFFEKHQPFVGYVQFRMEGSMPGNERIKSIKMQLAWGISGLSNNPKDPNAEKNRGGVWRFKAP
jgi:hypothetical protein